MPAVCHAVSCRKTGLDSGFINEGLIADIVLELEFCHLRSSLLVKNTFHQCRASNWTKRRAEGTGPINK